MGASDWVSFRSFGLLLLNLFLHDPTRLTVQRLTRSQAGIHCRPALTSIDMDQEVPPTASSSSLDLEQDPPPEAVGPGVHLVVAP